MDKGIEFDLIDWTELIEKYQDETPKKNSDGKKEKDKKIDERKKTLKQVGSFDNFITDLILNFYMTTHLTLRNTQVTKHRIRES